MRPLQINLETLPVAHYRSRMTKSEHLAQFRGYFPSIKYDRRVTALGKSPLILHCRCGRALHHLVHMLAHRVHTLLHVGVHHHAFTGHARHLIHHGRHLLHAPSHLFLPCRAHVALGHVVLHFHHLARHIVHRAEHYPTIPCPSGHTPFRQMCSAN